MQKGQVLSGRFEGYYFTLQKRPLDVSEFLPGDRAHVVNVYRGELFEARMDSGAAPPGDPPRDALCLDRVSNIQVHAGVLSPGQEPFVASFRRVVLRDVVVLESWELDGKTYGILNARFIGELEGVGEEPATAALAASTAVLPDPPRPVPPSAPPPSFARSSSGIFGGIDRGGSGCCAGGCLGTLLKLIGIWFALWLLFATIGTFFGNGGDNSEELRRLKEERAALKRENGRLQERFDSLASALEQADIDCTLRNYAQRIYFYGNQDRIREYSAGAVQDLAALMRKYPEVRIRIEGHMNPSTDVPEELQDLDLRRAAKVKELLLEQGIAEARIDVVGKGSTAPIVPSDQLDTDPWGNQYNRNMRVVIKIIQ